MTSNSLKCLDCTHRIRNKSLSKPHYKRVLLKISGEAFCTPGGFGIDGDELQVIAKEIADAAKLGTELAAETSSAALNLPRKDTFSKPRLITWACSARSSTAMH